MDEQNMPLSATEALDAAFKPGEPGVAAAIVRDGRVERAWLRGLASWPAGPAIDEATNFRIASVSKQFTAMAAMILADRGIIGFDEPITDVVAGLPTPCGGVTVRMLLNHTSGLPDYEDAVPDDSPVQALDKDIPSLIGGAPYFQPGSAYRYSNTGYALLALAVEARSGLGYADFVRSNIFGPLGMVGSGFVEAGGPPVARRALGYRETDTGSFEPADQSPTSAVLGDGGVYTSLEDYAIWEASLYGPTLVSGAMLERSFIPGALSGGAATDYGFGWRLEHRHGVFLTHHNGSTTGFSASVRRVPERRMALVIFANRSGDIAHRLGDELLGSFVSSGSI